jgi:uncharacterized protein (TIGR02271 family)
MPITTNDLDVLAQGGDVVTADSDKIGGIGQVYVDDQTGEPSWVTAKTGLFGTSESFVPLQGAQIRGSDIVVSYSKDQVKDAPRIDADGNLSPEEESTLYGYYGLGGGSSDSGYADPSAAGDASETAYAGTGVTGLTGDDRSATTGTDAGYADVDAGRGQASEGYDTSGPTTDDAMTRSEEQLRVGTQTQESGRARLRKYVVTEQVTQTIPVSHEEVRVEREPITDANIGDATSGPDISEEEHEVVLHEERPVAQKETVPVERVRLSTETVTGEETVSDEVRKEQIDTDVDSADAPRTAR